MKITGIKEATMLIRGWLIAANVPELVKSAFDFVFEAMATGNTETTTVYLDDDEIERIATIVALKIIDTGESNKIEPEIEQEIVQDLPDQEEEQIDEKEPFSYTLQIDKMEKSEKQLKKVK